MIVQRQDIPIHLGSLIPAMKTVAGFFDGDINEGDLILHNDPAYGGSHIIDTCMYYPVFYEGELVFWTVCKGHLTDIGGPVPAGYNPDAKEIYAEGLRIPPIKLWDKKVPRDDILNMLLTNMRARRDQEGDFNALIRLEGAEAAAKLDSLFKGLEAKGREDFAGDGFAEDKISIRRSLDMRYVGQVHECTVEIDPFDVTEDRLDDIKAAFHARHKELYTYDEPHSPVEVVNVESTIAGHVDKPDRMTIGAGNGADATLKGTRPMVFSGEGVAQDTPVYDGSVMGAGDELHGPAVIEEVTTTIVVEPGWTVTLHDSGVYVLAADAAGEDVAEKARELVEA